MKNLKHTLYMSSAILAMMCRPGMDVAAQEDTSVAWNPRQVEDVLEDLQYIDENRLQYTIQDGDTLSVIAEAMNIDTKYLAQLNEIEDIDVIYAGNIITAFLNQNHEVERIVVETAEGHTHQMDYAVNLSPLPVVEEYDAIAARPTNSQEVVATNVAPVETNDPYVEPVAETSMSTPAAPEEAAVEPKTDTVLSATYSVNETIGAETVTAPAIEDVVTETAVATPAPVTEEAAAMEESVELVIAEEPVVTEEPMTEAEEVPAYEEENLVNNGMITYTASPEEVAEEVVTEEVTTELIEEPAVQEVADPYANPQNAGLSADAARYKEEVAALYGVKDFSLVRPGDPGDHGSGHAVDFMVYDNTALGNDIANYSINNMAENNISYVIWQQQIYGDWNQRWEMMEDRGSITANHYDHVHVSFNH